ncbi:MAG: peptide chain release factor aRF-1 [Candidatus Nanoarchaeia archaeon]|nr:peptide chain release factor aRF-1 [Candidatus Nanoarchaeia archaeon]
MDKERYQLKQLVRYLESVRGRHTELVTVYVPAGYNLNIKINQLSDEAGTAGNIQSKTVRTNVVTAIERMITELRRFKQTPPNGLALFSGNVSEVEGKPDFRAWAINPPEPIRNNLYRCDSTFITEPLKELIEPKHTFGLVVVDLRDAAVAFLKGNSIVPVKEIESAVMGKFKAGGQSAGRFHRIRENQIVEFMKRTSALMSTVFREKKVEGIVVGGPGPAKEDLVDNYLSSDIKKLILGMVDIGYTGEQGLKELLAKSEDLFHQEEIYSEKKIVDRFLLHLAKDDGLESYGEEEVMKNLKNGTVELLILSESLPMDTVDRFSAEAEKFGTKIELISVDFPEGIQLKELGGIAAILRYKV